MKLIVASDSHYDKVMLMNLAREINRRGDIDAVIHLGDMEGDAAWLRKNLAQPVYGVPGNCDMNFKDPAERVISLGGTAVFLCHGHTLRVKTTLEPLSYRAEERGARLALFGHTHARCVRNLGVVLLVNPGALKDGRYALIEIEKGDLMMPKMLAL
ncbi:MAG: metallophosphoesterase [Clostridia bacterium]|nr:metallophosphoesterase [Clostridia bacterium]